MPEIVMASEQAAAPADLRQRVEAATGQRSTAWDRPDTGLSLAHRFVVTFEDGTKAFVKAATTDKTAAQLRNERVALAHAEVIAPRILAWLDGGNERPLLITEALEGHWPAGHRGVDWRPGDIDSVLDALAVLRGSPAPVGLAPAFVVEPIDWAGLIAQLRGTQLEAIASAAWFERNAPALADAEARLDSTGTAFVRGDMRSDNICLMPGGPRFVDWSNAHMGSPEADLARFLPAAHLEGGPVPFEGFPEGGLWAALQAGDLLRFALEETNLAWLRRVARWLAAINLDWAVASLGLEPRDGRKREGQES